MKIHRFESIFGHVHFENAQNAMLLLDEYWQSILNEELVASLLANIELEDTEVLSNKLNEWEHYVVNNSEAINSYRRCLDDICRTLFHHVYERIETEELRQDIISITYQIQHAVLDVWYPSSLRMLVMQHSRVRHLLLLSELYSKDADTQVNTWKHLFEMGCECINIRDELRYIDAFFPRYIDYAPYREPVSMDVSCFFQTFKKSYLGWSLIDWEKRQITQHVMRRELYAGLMYADLAYRKHLTSSKPEVVLHPYKINYAKLGYKNIRGRFQLQGNMNGFIGVRGNKAPTIVLAFSGTEFFSAKNWITNISQYFGHVDPVYLQAVGLLYSTRLGKSHRRIFKDATIEVYGHSLGGGLMQFSVACNRDKSVRGYGYNSAGIDLVNANYFVYGDIPTIWHLYRRYDYVFKIPGTVQLGKSVASLGIDPKLITAHFISSIRRSAGKYHVGVAELASK